jgi:hypothetical protein
MTPNTKQGIFEIQGEKNPQNRILYQRSIGVDLS